MSNKKGNISIHTENILPIIKKWLYSEKDIFIREIISNSSDAISKMKRIVGIGEVELDKDSKFAIKVVLDKKKKQLKFIDNGIGMTEEEVMKYINQIAFSGAEDFLEKYKDKTDEKDQIIGHFGLGFYSTFMVADKVQIDTLSYQKGAKAVRWISAGDDKYEIEDSDREERGTTVTLHISNDSKEFLDMYKTKEILLKYCAFLPYEIYFEDVDELKKEAEEAKKEAEKKAAEKAEKAKKEKTEGAKKKDGKVEDKKEEDDEVKEKEILPINDTNPLWLKSPKDCTDDEYKAFYRKVFTDFNEPLFWIHINIEYPFNLKGILYFPKMKHEFETSEGQIKLYYNQVFVADNAKEIIPEFLLLLKGVLDCPDLPLNISRSFLQNDKYVTKISTHITKKVADKLKSLFKKEKEQFNKFWDDINPFVKYGCIKEEKFYEKVKDIIVYKTINNEYLTLAEYLVKCEESHKNLVFYVSDENQQAQYINMFKDHGTDAIILNTLIDNHFVQFLEMKNNEVKFSRIDADITEILKEKTENEEDNKEEDKKLIEALEKIFKDISKNEHLKLKLETLKSESVSGMIILPEYSRRMQDMSKQFGMYNMGQMPVEETLVLNKKNKLISHIIKIKDDKTKKDDLKLISEHIYDLALLGHKQLSAEAMTKFIARSNSILTKIANIEKD